MEEKYRHFLFGIVASVGLCFIILVFFTGDEVCINSKLLNISEWVLFGLICATVISGLLFLFFVIKANHETRDIKNTKWHIVTECLQDQELRSKRNLLFHQDITVFPSSIISYCEAVEQVEFAGSDCYFIPGSFEGCVNLEYIKLPHRLERIPDNMFKNCSSLKEIIIPSTVKSIGKNAFYGCSKLTSVTFVKGSKLESIGRGAFKGCSGLTSVTFGEGSRLESIDNYAFMGCNGLTSVEIPESVTNIGRGAFKGCSGLSSMNFGYTNYWYYTSSLENAANKTGGGKFDLNLTNVELVKKYADYYWYKKKL